MSKLLKSIETIRKRVVSIDVLGEKFDLQAPTVESHIEYRKRLKEIDNSEEDKVSHVFMQQVAKLQACLVEDIEFNDLVVFMVDIRDAARPLLEQAETFFTVSVYDNKEKLNAQFKTQNLDEITEEEARVPFLLPGKEE